MKIIKIASTRSSRKKRVAAYCRVSTLMEEQEERQIMKTGISPAFTVIQNQVSMLKSEKDSSR